MRRRSIPIAAALALLLGACGEAPPAETVTDTTTVTAPEADRGEGRSRESGPTRRPAPTSGPTEQVSSLTLFSSPTGNIGCAIDAESARCDVGDYDWPPPPKPASCDFDWGGSVNVVGDAPGEVGCVSDTTRGSDKVLPYGESIEASSFRCTSAQEGMTCENADTGHGFFLARESYRVY